MDYKETLNLPKTDFPMRANLPQREPEMLKYWNEINLYKKLIERNREKEAFIFHDGPPYANGHIHIGTALNKILKDIVLKYKNLRGFFVPYTPGWDTHGLPIELKTMEGMKHETDILKIRDACKEYATKFHKIQMEEFKRLGTLADYDNPYLTYKKEFEAREMEIFKSLVEKDYIYRNLKPIYWCPSCVTALAEAEIEYDDHTSPSIYVRFKMLDLPEGLSKESHIVIWTTTPWTLPANAAICLHPDFDYVAFTHKGETYIVAEGLYNTFLGEVGFESTDCKIINKFKGKIFEGLKAKHPFIDRESLIIMGEHVTLDTGTGCVHTAPGHGADDYHVGLKYHLPIISPVDEHGKFTDEFEPMKGKYVESANKDIIELLDQKNALMGQKKINHSYPHCWRCKKPVIFRATPQWFVKVEKSDLREKALKACDSVNWVPAYGYQRITAMLKNRPDWCISRQRVWGVPIPAVYCNSCDTPILSPQIIEKAIKLFGENGSNCWWEKDINEFLPDDFKCPECGGKHFTKEKDILDVWFDSGVSHWAVLNEWPNLSWPADLYLEGSDQHRGWFQTSLLTSISAFNKAPYKTVLTHGFVVDGNGKKMSKSIGNVIKPDEIIKKYGADILRLWVASSDYQEDIRISNKIIGQMADAYRKIRNTARFLLGNIYDFDYKNNVVPVDEREDLDKYILMRFKTLCESVTASYEKYEFYKLYRKLTNFCTLDLSSFYLDIIKDRLYTSRADSKKRHSAQSTMYEILKALTVMIAPILTFSAEEIWKHIPDEELESVYFAEWPEIVIEENEDLKNKFDFLASIKEKAGKALENARNEKIIGHSLDADIIVFSTEKNDLLKENSALLREMMIVSKLTVADSEISESTGIYWDEDKKVEFHIRKSSGEKCPRCWQYADLNDKGICQRCADEL